MYEASLNKQILELLDIKVDIEINCDTGAHEVSVEVPSKYRYEALLQKLSEKHTVKIK